MLEIEQVVEDGGGTESGEGEGRPCLPGSIGSLRPSRDERGGGGRRGHDEGGAGCTSRVVGCPGCSLAVAPVFSVDDPALEADLLFKVVPARDNRVWVTLEEGGDASLQENGELTCGILHVEEEKGEAGEAAACRDGGGAGDGEGKGDGEMVRGGAARGEDG